MPRGIITKSEAEYIRRNFSTMALTDIADVLDRPPGTIRRWIEQNLSSEARATIDKEDQQSERNILLLEVKAKLRYMPEWLRMKDEFTQEELKFIEHRFGKLCAQFKNDITPSEETQIFLLIKFEVLMSRNLQEKKRGVTDTERIEKSIADIHRANPDISQADKNTLSLLENFEQQLVAIQAAQSSKTKEYVTLEEKHQTLSRDLKMTRDQRISQISESKQTFIDIIKMLQKEDIREKEGRAADLMRLAGEKEYKRLGELHKYSDGSIDRPILSADTVNQEE
jgi:hypothetical protein